MAPFDSGRRSAAPFPADREDRIDWPRIWPFVLVHLACGLVFVVGVSPVAVLVALGLYALRMLAITAVFHRLLAHRSYRCGRVLQFSGALLATMAAQRGPLWWAAHHRRHHRHTDRPADAHSPRQHGFWWSHVGWFLTRRNYRTDHAAVPDLARLPELRWLDRFDVVPPLLLAGGLFVLGEVLAGWQPQLGTSGLQLVVWGFCVSTVVLLHVTCMVNSVAHRFGTRPYPTRDDSRNNAWLALLTFGEGWHNNHHFHPGSTAQGFRWWEVDITWYVLRLLAALGLVHELRRPALAVLARRAARVRGAA